MKGDERRGRRGEEERRGKERIGEERRGKGENPWQNTKSEPCTFMTQLSLSKKVAEKDPCGVRKAWYNF